MIVRKTWFKGYLAQSKKMTQWRLKAKNLWAKEFQKIWFLQCEKGKRGWVCACQRVSERERERCGRKGWGDLEVNSDVYPIQQSCDGISMKNWIICQQTVGLQIEEAVFTDHDLLKCSPGWHLQGSDSPSSSITVPKVMGKVRLYVILLLVNNILFLFYVVFVFFCKQNVFIDWKWIDQIQMLCMVNNI
jgi:hypothetical protein